MRRRTTQEGREAKGRNIDIDGIGEQIATATGDIIDEPAPLAG